MIAAAFIADAPSIILMLGLISAAWYFRKGGGGTALESLETANRVLEKRVHELEDNVRMLETKQTNDELTIAELRKRTDVSLAIQPLSELITAHEATEYKWSEVAESRAAERHQQAMGVFERIAAQLNDAERARAAHVAQEVVESAKVVAADAIEAARAVAAETVSAELAKAKRKPAAPRKPRAVGR